MKKGFSIDCNFNGIILRTREVLKKLKGDISAYFNIENGDTVINSAVLY